MRLLPFALALCGLSCAERPIVRGLVLEVRQDSMVVSHKEIPGVMPAMAMPVRVKRPAELARLKPGSVIEFRLIDSIAHDIHVIAVDNSLEQDGRRVRLDRPKEAVNDGDPVPDFTLTTETGAVFRLSDLRGRVVVIQFLYTRCPLPEVCPRLAATFSRIARRFADRTDLALVTITLDPRFDTPEVLTRYAKLYRGAARNWFFLTGAEDSVRDVAALFGMVYFPDEGVITHTSTVALINRDGRLAATVEGLGFDARQLGDLVESVLNGSKSAPDSRLMTR